MPKAIDSELRQLMKALLTEASEKHKSDDADKGFKKGAFKLQLEDRLAIFDRGVRLAALELKVEEGGEGSAWNTTPGEKGDD